MDLIRERDAELAELRSAVAVMETEVANRVTTNRAPTASSLHALFDRYAASGAANPKTVRKWRARLVNLVSFLRHDDASRVTRADLNRWIEELVSKGLAKKTIIDGYTGARVGEIRRGGLMLLPGHLKPHFRYSLAVNLDRP